MKQAKYLMIVVLLAIILSFGNPPVTRALADVPPAIILVQDKDDKMLVNHNFVYDKRVFVQGDTESDPGFYVNIPERK